MLVIGYILEVQRFHENILMVIILNLYMWGILIKSLSLNQKLVSIMINTIFILICSMSKLYILLL